MRSLLFFAMLLLPIGVMACTYDVPVPAPAPRTGCVVCPPQTLCKKTPEKGLRCVPVHFSSEGPSGDIGEEDLDDTR